MKKVRIDWNRTEGAWTPSRFYALETADTSVLPAMTAAYGQASVLRCVLDVASPEDGFSVLAVASAHAKEVLLSLEGGYAASAEEYEAAVLPILRRAAELCPALTYVEVVCAPREAGISDDGYYACYRGAYHAIARLARPLKLGGCGVEDLLNRADVWLSFLENLAKDKDPEKRLDFYSYREALQDYPVRIWLMHEAHIAWLREFDLPTLPIFLDGLTLTRREELTGEREENGRNAATLITAVIAATEWPEFALFARSVLDPAPAYTQFCKTEEGFRTTANAHAVRMLASLEGERLTCDIIEESWPPQKDIVAVKRDGALSVLLCNPTDEPTYIKFTVADIPYKKLKIHKYLVDSKHNTSGEALYATDGIYQSPTKIKNSENVEMLGGADTREELDGTVTVECNLREHAFCLFTLEPYA